MTETPLADGAWRVDPRRSEVGFAVKDLWGVRIVRGVFGEYDGGLEVRADGAEGELTVEARSIDTGNDKRDQHLRSAAFFDVERHPRIAFAASAVTPREGGLTLAGELAIRSSRARLEVPVSVGQMAGGALCLEGRTTVSRKAVGVTWNKLGMIRGDAMLHVRLTLEPATEAAR